MIFHTDINHLIPNETFGVGMAYLTSPQFTVEEEELVQCPLLEARALDQPYCSPAISVPYRTNGMGYPYGKLQLCMYCSLW